MNHRQRAEANISFQRAANKFHKTYGFKPLIERESYAPYIRRCEKLFNRVSNAYETSTWAVESVDLAYEYMIETALFDAKENKGAK